MNDFPYFSINPQEAFKTIMASLDELLQHL
jgi:hypothetical protein